MGSQQVLSGLKFCRWCKIVFGGISMPRELVALDIRKPMLRGYEDDPVPDAHVRVKVLTNMKGELL